MPQPPQILEIPNKDMQLTSCFYCDNPLPAKTGEHIFNSCWGGSHKTKRLICDECNNQFSDIDATFQIYTDAIMNANLFEGERHKGTRIIDNPNWDCYLDAGLKPKQKNILIEENNKNGIINIKILFPSKTQLRKWLNSDQAESLFGRKLSEEEQKNYLAQAKSEQDYIDKLEVIKPINLNHQYRSTAHTALKCLAFFIPQLVTGEDMKEIREFARYGKGDWRYFAVDVEQFFSFPDVVPWMKLDVHYNSMEIYWCSYLGMVVGVLNILNRVKRAVILSRNYSGDEKYLLMFENTYPTGKQPEGTLQKIDFRECPNFLTIGVQHFADPTQTYQFFQQEMNELMFRCTTDAIIVKFTENINKINQKNYTNFDELIKDYKDAILQILRQIDSCLQKSVNFDPIELEMDSKFSKLPKSEDREFLNKEALKIWQSLMNEFLSSKLS